MPPASENEPSSSKRSEKQSSLPSPLLSCPFLSSVRPLAASLLRIGAMFTMLRSSWAKTRALRSFGSWYTGGKRTAAFISIERGEASAALFSTQNPPCLSLSHRLLLLPLSPQAAALTQKSKMTYAGYVPAKIASVKTPLQVALAALESGEALELLSLLCRNAACAPSEPKYRKVRATNSRVVASCEACGEEAFVGAMQALGWSKSAAVEGEEGEFFVLAPGKGSMAQVREIQDAITELKRSSRVKTVRAISSRSNLAAGTEESEDAKRIKEQMRADAQERGDGGPRDCGFQGAAAAGGHGLEGERWRAAGRWVLRRRDRVRIGE